MKLRVTILVSCFLLTFAPPSIGAAELERVSRNANFNHSFSTWNWGSLTARRVTRKWVPDANNPVESKLGSRLLRLRADNPGGFGQFLDIAPGTRYQVVALQAFRRSRIDRTLGGWVGFGISYYDQNWNEVAKFEREILGPKRNGPSRGAGDGIQPYSLGCIVPPNAVHALMFVWMQDPDTQVFVDEWAAFNYSPPQDGIAKGFELAQVQGSPTTLTGTEFFLPAEEHQRAGITTESVTTNLKGSISTRDTLAIGAPDSDTVAYQPLLLQQGKTYTMLFRIQGNVPTSYLGIDYFDANGNEIDEYVRELNAGNSNPFTGAPRFVLALPPGAVKATFWVWVAPTENPLNLDLLLLNENP